MKLYDKVLKLLTEIPALRDSDKKLIWAVWESQGACNHTEFIPGAGAFRFTALSKEKFFNIAETPESITRARRKVQENHPELQAKAQIKDARDFKESYKGNFIFHENV